MRFPETERVSDLEFLDRRIPWSSLFHASKCKKKNILISNIFRSSEWFFLYFVGFYIEKLNSDYSKIPVEKI